jgi:thiamine biosynthesis lipoprotein ApbE
VISDRAFISDAYSTALFLLPPHRAVEIANSTANLETLIYFIENNELKSVQSTGFKKYEVSE